MTHPRLYKFHWIGTARGLTGGRFTLCSVWLFGVLLLQIPFTHSVSSNQAARPLGGQDHGRDPGPGASFFLLLRSFCYFSDHYHLSRGEGGEYEKGWNGISQFCYFRNNRSRQKASEANGGLLQTGAELPGGIQMAVESPDWRLPYSFIVHDSLVRMWKNILDR